VPLTKQDLKIFSEYMFYSFLMGKHLIPQN